MTPIRDQKVRFVKVSKTIVSETPPMLIGDALVSYWQHSETDPLQQSEIDPPPAGLGFGAVGAYEAHL